MKVSVLVFVAVTVGRLSAFLTRAREITFNRDRRALIAIHEPSIRRRPVVAVLSFDARRPRQLCKRIELHRHILALVHTILPAIQIGLPLVVAFRRATIKRDLSRLRLRCNRWQRPRRTPTRQSFGTPRRVPARRGEATWGHPLGRGDLS